MEGGKETGEKPGDQTGSGHRVDPGPDEKHHLPRPTGQAEAARHSSGRGESALRCMRVRQYLLAGQVVASLRWRSGGEID